MLTAKVDVAPCGRYEIILLVTGENEREIDQFERR